MKSFRTVMAAFLAISVLSLGVAGCDAFKGDEDVDTADGEGGLGKGPGLFTGKEGALVIESEVWEGAGPSKRDRTAE